MPRAVLDSSVLVSAFITPHGSVVRLLRAPARGRYDLCLSDDILAETAETLLTKPRLRRFAAYADADVHDYIRWLLMQAEMVRNVHPIRAVPNDPDDDIIIAAAIAAKADYLVTGDRAHLLPIGTYQGIRIVTPSEFLAELG